MIEELQQWASERGYQIAWGPYCLVDEAKAEIAARLESGELDQDLYRAELASVAARDKGYDRSWSTVIMIARPAPAHRVSFDLGERRLETLLPPTYFRYRPTFEEVRQDLARHLHGVQVEHLTAPYKALANRLGLVSYGRNNITYARGIGSYLQLCGYVTDARLTPLAEAREQAALLPECDRCSTCRAACPTGAIGDDRMLLRAQRCLTFANESSGQWPQWLPERAHHCLVGCLACQRACPVNPKLPVVDTEVCFSVAETRHLLAGDQHGEERSESGIRYKLAWLGQPYIESVLGRNLGALLQRRRWL